MSAPQAQQTPPPQRTYPERAVRGEIEAANENGIKIAGEWFDFGTYYQGVRPGRGQVVEAVARGRFLRRVTVLAGAGPGDAGEPGGPPDDGFAGPPPPPADDDDPATWGRPGGGAAPRRVATQPAPGARPAAPGARPAGSEAGGAGLSGAAAAGRATRAAPVPPAAPPALPAGDGTVLRAAALVAAAEFHSRRGSEEDDVYGTAYRFLAWLTDEEDGA